MGTGTNGARMAGNAAQADAIDNMKDQLIIALVKRLGGNVVMPVAEIDNTGGHLLLMQYDQPAESFVFKLEQKQ